MDLSGFGWDRSFGLRHSFILPLHPSEFHSDLLSDIIRRRLQAIPLGPNTSFGTSTLTASLAVTSLPLESLSSTSLPVISQLIATLFGEHRSATHIVTSAKPIFSVTLL